MKKLTATLLILLLALLLLAGCQSKKTTSEPSVSDTPEESSVSDIAPSPSVPSVSEPSKEKVSLSPLPENVDISAKKEGTSVTIRLSLPDAAEKEVSLVILTDLSYRYSWAENPEEGLCDVAQLALDDKGQGEASLYIKNATDTFYLVVTTADGTSYTLTI